MDIFEKEYAQGLQETAADQFLKLAAELDGSDVLDKLNPGEIPGASVHPVGVDSRALDPGLRAVEGMREGRGKITALAERVTAARKHPVDRDVSPVLSGGTRNPRWDDVNSVLRMKTAAHRNPTPEQARTAGAPAQTDLTKEAAEQRSTWDRWGKSAAIGGGLALGGIAAGGGALLAGRKLLGAQKAYNQKATGAAGALLGDFMKGVRRELDTMHKTTKSIQQASGGIVDASKSLNNVAGDMNRTMRGMNATMSGMAQDMGSTMRGMRSDMGSAMKGVQDVTHDIQGASKAIQGAGDALGNLPSGAKEYAGGLLGKIMKRGAEGSAAMMMMKVASEGKVRTLEGWHKTAAEDDPYVKRVGREAGQGGAVMGGTLGAAGGAFGGLMAGARKGRPGLGALIGGASGAAVGAVGGGLGLKAIGEHNARKLSPKQRNMAGKFNTAHDQYKAGNLSRDQYTKAVGSFLRSRGMGHMTESVANRMA